MPRVPLLLSMTPAALPLQVVLTEDGDVVLASTGRTYFQIGQGTRSQGAFPLAKDQACVMC